MFISIEGIDGSGKSTLARKLTESLKASDFQVKYVCEPWLTKEGRLIRRDSNKLTLEDYIVLSSIDRQKILKSLKKDELTVYDSYKYTWLAFLLACGYDEGKALYEFSKYPEPDLVIFLDIAPKEAIRRLEKARKVGIPDEAAKLLEKMASEIQKNLPAQKLVLDGEKPTEEHLRTLKRAFSL